MLLQSKLILVFYFTFTHSSILQTLNEKLGEKVPPSKKEARQCQGDASLSDQGNFIDRGKKDKDKKTSNNAKEVKISGNTPESSEVIKKKGKRKAEDSESSLTQKP